MSYLPVVAPSHLYWHFSVQFYCLGVATLFATSIEQSFPVLTLPFTHVQLHLFFVTDIQKTSAEGMKYYL